MYPIHYILFFLTLNLCSHLVIFLMTIIPPLKFSLASHLGNISSLIKKLYLLFLMLDGYCKNTKNLLMFQICISLYILCISNLFHLVLKYYYYRKSFN